MRKHKHTKIFTAQGKRYCFSCLEEMKPKKPKKIGAPAKKKKYDHDMFNELKRQDDFIANISHEL